MIGITLLSPRLRQDAARPAGGSSLSASAGVGSSQKDSLRLSRGSSIYPYKVVGQHNLTRTRKNCPVTFGGGRGGATGLGPQLRVTIPTLCKPQPKLVTTGTNYSYAPFARRVAAGESSESQPLSPSHSSARLISGHL